MTETKKPTKFLWIFYIILLAGLILFNLVISPLASLAEIQRVDYATFISMLDDERIGRVHIKENTGEITFKEKGGVQLYSTVRDGEDDLAERLAAAKVTVSGEELTERRDALSIIIYNWLLPIIAFAIVGLVIFYPRIVGQKSEQLFAVVKTKWFWLYFVVAGITAAISLFLLPIWEKTTLFFRYWSIGAVQIILALLIVAYIVMYLLRTFASLDLPRTRVLQAVKIAEIAALVVLIVFCIVEHFGLVSFVGPCFVIGCVLYLRGLVQGIKGYLYTHKKKESYSVLQLIFCFAALTLGTILIINPFGGEGFMWIISISVWISTALLIVWGILSMPMRAATPEGDTEARAEREPEAAHAPEAKPEGKPKAKPKAKPEAKPADTEGK